MKWKINGRIVVILHDDGSTHDFIFEKVVRALKFDTAASQYKVKATSTYKK